MCTGLYRCLRRVFRWMPLKQDGQRACCVYAFHPPALISRKPPRSRLSGFVINHAIASPDTSRIHVGSCNYEVVASLGFSRIRPGRSHVSLSQECLGAKSVEDRFILQVGHLPSFPQISTKRTTTSKPQAFSYQSFLIVAGPPAVICSFCKLTFTTLYTLVQGSVRDGPHPLIIKHRL